jgi:hypothetical protein
VHAVQVVDRLPLLQCWDAQDHCCAAISVRLYVVQRTLAVSRHCGAVRWHAPSSASCSVASRSAGSGRRNCVGNTWVAPPGYQYGWEPTRSLPQFGHSAQLCMYVERNNTSCHPGAQVGSVEIERAVVEGVAVVAEAAAVGVPSPGGGPEQLQLFVVLRAPSVPCDSASASVAGAPGKAAGDSLLQACRAEVRRKLNPLFKVMPARPCSSVAAGI